MSYQGYQQVLCKNGHYFEVSSHEGMTWHDGPAFDMSLIKCPYCQESAVFVNGVDETNGLSQGLMDFSSLLIRAAEVQTCNLGHTHEVVPAIYRIPAVEEAETLRYYCEES